MDRVGLAERFGRKPVAVEVSGEVLHVRAFSTAERLAFAKRANAVKDDADREAAVMVALFAAGVCDPEGNRLYGDTAADLAAVGDLDGAFVQAVAEMIADRNGLTAGNG